MTDLLKRGEGPFACAGEVRVKRRDLEALERRVVRLEKALREMNGECGFQYRSPSSPRVLAARRLLAEKQPWRLREESE